MDISGKFSRVQRVRCDADMVSADLTELGRTPVAVISSGCKSFLDIPRTLEYLETEGVLVGTFADGRTGSVDFPAFWTRESGIKSPKVIKNEADAAAMICTLVIPVQNVFDLPLHQTLNFSYQSLQAYTLQTLCQNNIPFLKSKWTRSSKRQSNLPRFAAFTEVTILHSSSAKSKNSVVGRVSLPIGR